ncbi:hypothetical protein RND71_036019 [Anisodus tanguticus]|uniref:Uncharacterized protein n=1 Tax=Anisodus tanguticus TaxID=243964 RepID=A0AAE1R6Q7_9SOLA|nr:hypothetical protein RND71_036019 [Anisodus tanguticus]
MIANLSELDRSYRKHRKNYGEASSDDESLESMPLKWQITYCEAATEATSVENASLNSPKMT